MIKLGISCALLACLSGMGVSAKAETVNSKATRDGQTRAVDVEYRLETPSGDGPFPVVVLLQSCGGSDSAFTRFWPGELKQWGYAVATVRSLEARGLRTCERGTTVDRSMELTIDLAADAYATLDKLAATKGIDVRRSAVVGFSLGAGAINWRIMKQWEPRNGPDFKATAAFYYRCPSLMESLPRIPTLQVTAGQDNLHHRPCAEFDNARNPFPAANLQVLTFPDAHHAFDVPENSGRRDVGGVTMRYDAQARDTAATALKAFLARHLR